METWSLGQARLGILPAQGQAMMVKIAEGLEAADAGGTVDPNAPREQVPVGHAPSCACRMVRITEQQATKKRRPSALGAMGLLFLAPGTAGDRIFATQ